jgi:hypothetical protein
VLCCNLPAAWFCVCPQARLTAPVWQQLQRLLLTGSFFGDVPGRTEASVCSASVPSGSVWGE